MQFVVCNFASSLQKHYLHYLFLHNLLELHWFQYWWEGLCLLQLCLIMKKNNPVSFSLLQHTLSSHLPRPSASVWISFCQFVFDAHPVCRGAAPCSPHRSPFRSSLNPADHNRAGFQGGSQSTPNTPKVRQLHRRGAYVTSVSVF